MEMETPQLTSAFNEKQREEARNEFGKVSAEHSSVPLLPFKLSFSLLSALACRMATIMLWRHRAASNRCRNFSLASRSNLCLDAPATASESAASLPSLSL